MFPNGGRRENFWGISCEKLRFYAQKSYFFQLRKEARKFMGYFVWKITILRQKIIFFPILGPPPPLDTSMVDYWICPDEGIIFPILNSQCFFLFIEIHRDTTWVCTCKNVLNYLNLGLSFREALTKYIEPSFPKQNLKFI